MNKKIMKLFVKLLLLLVGGFAVTFGIYWFNLENKLIFYVIRPVLNKIYNKQKRAVKL